jgi:hypothetical protein
MTENDIIDKLAKHFTAPAWAFFPQVRNHTGYGGGTRTVDAVAMSLYPSRGLYLHGFEIKVNRGDWLRELKDPEKAEDFSTHLDFFTLVTPPDIAQKGEVPAKWGHIVVKGKNFHYAKTADLLRKEDAKFDREFVASLLRKAHEAGAATPGVVALREAERRGREEGAETFKEMVKKLTDKGAFDLEQLQNRIKMFEERSGIKVDTWGAGDIGDAVRMVMIGKMAFEQIGNDLVQIGGRARQIDDEVKSLLNMYEKLKESRKQDQSK